MRVKGRPCPQRNLPARADLADEDLNLAKAFSAGAAPCERPEVVAVFREISRFGEPCQPNCLSSRRLCRGELGEPDRIQDRDRPSLGGDRAFAHELAEHALHHLAHGRGRICKLLLRHVSDEIATR